MKVQVIKSTRNELPVYETVGSAGCDLRAELSLIQNKFLFNSETRSIEGQATVIIYPGGRALIPTGLQIALPQGYEARIQPRSGLALKNGISVLNTPGCIDSDYRGDIGVILVNHGTSPFEVKQGDRIAQMIISKVEQAEFVQVDTLNDTERGAGGFGHTGNK